MISLRFKSTLAIALICFVLGCCTVMLFTTKCNNAAGQPTLTRATLLKELADSLHTQYKTTIDQLKKNNRQLDLELQNTKIELKAAKEKTNRKAAEIKKLVTPGYPASELLKKTVLSTSPIDSSLQKCDSLALLVSDYLQDVEEKDSLYETQLVQQDSLLTGKDNIIALQNSENSNLSILYNQSLAQQTLLEKDNHSLRKKIKRKKATSKWLALGSALITGITTHYLSNR